MFMQYEIFRCFTLNKPHKGGALDIKARQQRKKQNQKPKTKKPEKIG
jgi:hypothetical protein